MLVILNFPDIRFVFRYNSDEGDRCVVRSPILQSSLEIELDANTELCEDRATFKSSYLEIELVSSWITILNVFLKLFKINGDQTQFFYGRKVNYRPFAFLEFFRDRGVGGGHLPSVFLLFEVILQKFHIAGSLRQIRDWGPLNLVIESLKAQGTFALELVLSSSLLEYILVFNKFGEVFGIDIKGFVFLLSSKNSIVEELFDPGKTGVEIDYSRLSPAAGARPVCSVSEILVSSVFVSRVS
ncbi:hypothetical protein Bca4012_063664 [Brassica carinata]